MLMHIPDMALMLDSSLTKEMHVIIQRPNTNIIITALIPAGKGWAAIRLLPWIGSLQVMDGVAPCHHRGPARQAPHRRQPLRTETPFLTQPD